MDTASREQYVFHHLTLIDMERARTSLDLLRGATDKHIQEALFRDAVVCYAKPFSGNKNLAGKNVLRMEESFVPSALEVAHKEVLTLRNSVIAHVDLDKQAPQVSIYEINGKKKVMFGVKGYERIFTSHLVDPLDSLAAKAHAYCIAKLGALESAASQETR
jgi:hypothetical protein